MNDKQKRYPDKGKIKPKSRLASCSSQKTNGRIWFVCFFTLHGKQIKFVHSFFWENLQLASLLFGFMWPLLALFASYSISKFPTYSFISLYVLFLWYLVKISTLLEYTRLYWPYLFNWHLSRRHSMGNQRNPEFAISETKCIFRLRVCLFSCLRHDVYFWTCFRSSTQIMSL